MPRVESSPTSRLFFCPRSLRRLPRLKSLLIATNDPTGPFQGHQNFQTRDFSLSCTKVFLMCLRVSTSDQDRIGFHPFFRLLAISLALYLDFYALPYYFQQNLANDISIKSNTTLATINVLLRLFHCSHFLTGLACDVRFEHNFGNCHPNYLIFV